MRLRILGTTLLFAAAAAAQDQASTGESQPNASAANGQAFADPSLLFGGSPGAYVGLAVNNIQGEGSYASTVINTEFNLGPVGLGLSLPLNLLLWNNDQCCTGAYTRDSKTYGGIIRRRDWAEAHGYTHLV